MASFIKEHLEYNPESGNLLWKKSPKCKIPPDKIAGTKNPLGYTVIKIKGKLYLAHRIAWLLHAGEWPKALIDHINGDPADNRIKNLRLATKRLNAQNQKIHRSGKVLLGASPVKNSKKFSVQVVHSKKRHYVGIFNSKEEAHNAYLNFIKINKWE